jgi:hypothetical protein
LYILSYYEDNLYGCSFGRPVKKHNKITPNGSSVTNDKQTNSARRYACVTTVTIERHLLWNGQQRQQQEEEKPSME